MASSSSSSIQKTETTSNEKEMKQLKHFSHDHLLSLVQLQTDHIKENTDKEDDQDEDEDEDEGEDKDDIVAENLYVGTCKMCEEEIYSFQLCYYSCEKCEYTLHKFCAELPETQDNHSLHLNHKLTLSKQFQLDDPDYLKFSRTEANSNIDMVDNEWMCSICDTSRSKFYNYHCSICKFNMDIICATMSEQIMKHPSHPHQLQRNTSSLISSCYACGDKHSGTFYQCTTCSWFRIHLDCALLPAKLLIQQSTDGSFSHSHLLTLAYSFPYTEQKAKLFPRCRACDKPFMFDKWHYGCSKCRYYVHVDCATSRKDAFMSSILMPAGFGKIYKIYKNYKVDYPNVIHCPFPDEGVNLLTHHFINKGEPIMKEIDGERFSHPHPLILVDTLTNGSRSLHDRMKKVEIMCDGCMRPIMEMPFYKCSQHHCDFVLHEWCTRLPFEIQNHHHHPNHSLVFLAKFPEKLLGVFNCVICRLPCNGFAYRCRECDYCVDIDCGFIPDVITHEAHPNHPLVRFNDSSVTKYCNTCRWWIPTVGFQCPTCDFYLHTKCALLIPRTIKHRYDKHPLALRYNPVEDHISEYFCDICEDEFNPIEWFYHCNTCASFMHTSCAPLKLQCEQSTYYWYEESIFKYINVKFGGTLIEIEFHPHPLTFVQGINADGQCIVCGKQLQYNMIFKCFQCKFAIHYECLRREFHGLYDA